MVCRWGCWRWRGCGWRIYNGRRAERAIAVRKENETSELRWNQGSDVPFVVSYRLNAGNQREGDLHKIYIRIAHVEFEDIVGIYPDVMRWGDDAECSEYVPR